MRYSLKIKGKTLMAAIVAVWISIATVLVFTGTIHAQVDLEAFALSSPPNPVGSGARAMGMGGAFVAVADDATAASWNPAGLVHLQKPEISAVYSLERHIERRNIKDVNLIFSSEFDDKDKYTISDINYLSMSYPFNLARRNLVFSLNYQRLYDFTRKLNYQFSFQFYDLTGEITSNGSLYTLSPALAVRATENIFLGVTINIWSDKWTGKSDWDIISKVVSYDNTDPNNTDPQTQIINQEYRNFKGLNVNLGLLYRITPQWTIGAVYKTPFRGKFDYKYYNSDNVLTTDEGLYGKLESIDFPSIYALGMAYRFTDAWSISADITRKDWDKMIWHNNKGERYSLFPQKDPNSKEESFKFPRVDPTYAFRIGIEYLKILDKTVIPFRGGIFYDPIPSIGSPQSEYGFSAGSGISIGDLIIDFTYQYRARSDVPGEERGLSHGIYEDKKQHVFLVSTIYHF